MKPAHIKEQRRKTVRNIRKRQRAIYQEIKELGYKKLEEPIRHGWFKEIVLTENIERYKNKIYIQELYDCIEKSFCFCFFFCFFNDTATTEIYTLSLHDALPIFLMCHSRCSRRLIILFFLLLCFTTAHAPQG